MKLTLDIVQEAMARNQGGVVSSMTWLRRQGYKFADEAFRELVKELGDEPTADTASRVLGGTILNPAKRRRRADGKTFIFTCAQSNTAVHSDFFTALKRYADFTGAELHVSRFTYNKDSLGAKGAKTGTAEASDTEDVWYDPVIEPYISDESLAITEDLVWCGELNIIPTRVNPLSSVKTYTRKSSGIIPHAKMAMESIPTMKHEPARFLYTTGTVTQRNYIQKIAGQVAEFHHVFGALIVEVDADGTWYARQLNADSSGCFYDLGYYVDSTGVHEGNGVLAITHGDIHVGKADWDVLHSVFGRPQPDRMWEPGIVDKLKPQLQFFHDIIDFTPRNHHNRKDPHFLWNDENMTSVEFEFEQANSVLDNASREYSKLFVVTSNHDQAILSWLKDHTAFYDPRNVEFWLRMNLRVRRGCKYPFMFALLEKANVDVTVLHEDDSYLIGGEIEAGLHGHLGPNGARGTPRNLKTVGKANTGHTHSAGIIEGVYTAGVYGALDMGYNKGLSSWSHSFIVTYLNNKRAIYTIKNGKAWR